MFHGNCCAMVITHGLNFLRKHHCRNKGSIERDGKLYCGIHDPVAVDIRRAAKKEVLDRKLSKKRKIALALYAWRLRRRK